MTSKLCHAAPFPSKSRNNCLSSNLADDDASCLWFHGVIVSNCWLMKIECMKDFVFLSRISFYDFLIIISFRRPSEIHVKVCKCREFTFAFWWTWYETTTKNIQRRPWKWCFSQNPCHLSVSMMIRLSFLVEERLEWGEGTDGLS